MKNVTTNEKIFVLQYCDIYVKEIQDMLAKLPDVPEGTLCHLKRGWLPNGFDDQCREIINRQVRALLRKEMNIPEVTSLPRKRKFTRRKYKKTDKKKLTGTHFMDMNNTEFVFKRDSEDEWEDVSPE